MFCAFCGNKLDKGELCSCPGARRARGEVEPGGRSASDYADAPTEYGAGNAQPSIRASRLRGQDDRDIYTPDDVHDPYPYANQQQYTPEQPAYVSSDAWEDDDDPIYEDWDEDGYDEPGYATSGHSLDAFDDFDDPKLSRRRFLLKVVPLSAAVILAATFVITWAMGINPFFKDDQKRNDSRKLA